jgi:hypothetical protein
VAGWCFLYNLFVDAYSERPRYIRPDLLLDDIFDEYRRGGLEDLWDPFDATAEQ